MRERNILCRAREPLAIFSLLLLLLLLAFVEYACLRSRACSLAYSGAYKIIKRQVFFLKCTLVEAYF
jgi:hypothetical protein